jgi:OOP family OmpA-OmpF porin
MTVKAESYRPQTIECVVKPGETQTTNIVMKKPESATIVDDEIVLSNSIFFEFNSAELKDESYATLNEVVDILKAQKQLPEINIEGHTDSIGSASYNKKLSLKRAQSVRDYLIEQGIDAEKLRAAGFGETKPVSTNLSEEGRAENRRVEFNIVAGDGAE